MYICMWVHVYMYMYMYVYTYCMYGVYVAYMFQIGVKGRHKRRSRIFCR